MTTTVFDILTVTCFIGLVVAFFQFTDRERTTLLHFLLAGVVFAVANQVGNGGHYDLAGVLVVAGIAYAAVSARR